MHHPARRIARETAQTAAQAAFTLHEVLMGIVFCTVAFLGLAGMQISNANAIAAAAEEAMATNAYRNLAERIRSATFRDAYDAWNGRSFSVDELGGYGVVTFFIDETDSSSEAAVLGFPRDLDGDGNATSIDVSTSYMLLPVKLEISWNGRYGTERRNYFYLLSQED